MEKYYHLYKVEPGVLKGVGTLQLQQDEFGERWEYDCCIPDVIADWLDIVIYDLLDGISPEDLLVDIPDGWALFP